MIFKAVQFMGKLKYGLYLVSAIAFVFSLQIKLSVITIIPTVALIIFLNQQNSFIKRIIDIIIWSVAVILVFVLGSLTIFLFPTKMLLNLMSVLPLVSLKTISPYGLSYKAPYSTNQFI